MDTRGNEKAAPNLAPAWGNVRLVGSKHHTIKTKTSNFTHKATFSWRCSNTRV